MESLFIMLPDTVTMNIPLQTDASGTIRVSGTRVTLDTVLTAFHQGETPQEIHRNFDVLPVNDIYAVIAYYLANRETLDAYLERRAEEAERLRQEIEANYTPEQRAHHERIRALIEEKRRNQDT